ncbi:hypothetical protein [Pseudomonas putida]
MAEASHFTSATFSLNIAVPTLSRWIKEMEEEFTPRLRSERNNER